MKYIVYSEDGRILRTGSTPDKDISLQAGDNELVIEGVASDENHYICNGEIVSLPEKPSNTHKFDYKNKVWYDPRSLQDLKNEAWQRIKKDRESYIDADLETPYGTFDSGPKDRASIMNTVSFMQTKPLHGSTVTFTLANNKTVELNTDAIMDVSLLLGQKIQTAHAIARERRDAINAATTKEQLDAIVW